MRVVDIVFDRYGSHACRQSAYYLDLRPHSMYVVCVALLLLCRFVSFVHNQHTMTASNTISSIVDYSVSSTHPDVEQGAASDSEFVDRCR